MVRMDSVGYTENEKEFGRFLRKLDKMEKQRKNKKKAKQENAKKR